MRTVALSMGITFGVFAGTACSGSDSNDVKAQGGASVQNIGGTGTTLGGAAGMGGESSSLSIGGGSALGGTDAGGTRTGGASGTLAATGGAGAGGASLGGQSNTQFTTGGAGIGGTVATGGKSAGGAAGSAATTGGAPAATGGTGAAAGGTGGMAATGGGTTTNCSSSKPAVVRGGQYFTFVEKFNRYYTDCAWKPSTTIYVSPTGGGNGSSRTTPTTAATALGAAAPGQMIVFTAGSYSGCFELDSDHSGTYDSPIVLTGEPKGDGTPGVTINCCTSGRRTCVNLEAADYVAVDGFELVGGDYGVRAVGAGYPANEHQKGVAVLNSIGHGQNRDPFFTGQSDWFVIERCTGYDPGSGDGHGIYLSNGSDWNIARFNETYNTVSSDFQINADPISTCADDGVAYDDSECDAVAGSSTTGGRGASDFMLVEGNFFHHSQAQGPNFTSVRNSTIINNIFALPARHGASFWQETDNPRLGSSNNLVAHNLFVAQASDRQAIGFTNSSADNRFSNNVIVAVSITGATVSANANGQLLATDATTIQTNTFEHNAWISGYFGSEDSAPAYTPNSTELRQTTFDASWFAAFPTTVGHDPMAFAPGSTAPWLDQGNLMPEVPVDRAGITRAAPVDLGPYER